MFHFVPWFRVIVRRRISSSPAICWLYANFMRSRLEPDLAKTLRLRFPRLHCRVELLRPRLDHVLPAGGQRLGVVGRAQHEHRGLGHADRPRDAVFRLRTLRQQSMSMPSQVRVHLHVIDRQVVDAGREDREVPALADRHVADDRAADVEVGFFVPASDNPT
jgi:hypothetical protein